MQKSGENYFIFSFGIRYFAYAKGKKRYFGMVMVAVLMGFVVDVVFFGKINENPACVDLKCIRNKKPLNKMTL